MQKQQLGLLDPESAAFSADADDDEIDLDPPHHRAIAATIAEKSVTLLSDGGILPLASDAQIAVLGPNAHRTAALFGCYSFANHVLERHPEVEMGFEVATLFESLNHDFSSVLGFAPGCAVDDDDTSQIAEAVELATTAGVAVIAVGDHAGLFGRGTVGEGCDRDSLELPGVQRQLVEAVLDSGTPLVLVVISGRPYAIDWAAARGAAIVQAFFPGEEGAAAISGAIVGRLNPAGRLAVSVPRSSGSQPYSYLHPRLGEPSEVSNLTTAPAFPFGFGLNYTSFSYSEAGVDSETIAADGRFDIHFTVSNTGAREGDEVVQVYANDVVGSVTRPTRQLIAFTRVTLQPGESRTLSMSIPTTRIAFSDRSLTRIVEPGDVRLWLGSDCETEAAALGTVTITGPVHAVTTDDSRTVDITVVA